MNGRILHSDWGWRSSLGRYHSWWDDPEFVQDETPGRPAYIPSTASSVMWYIGFDLGSAQECDCFAVIAHNSYLLNASHVFVRVGVADNGSTFDQDVFKMIPTAGCEPSFMGTFTAQTKRYWELAIQHPDASETLEVGSFLIGSSYTFDKMPDEPFSQKPEGQATRRETVASSDTVREHGTKRRHRQVKWTAGTSTMAGQFRTIHRVHDGDFHPIAFAPHDAESLVVNTGIDAYSCELHTMERLTISQLADSETFDISLSLREVV